LFRSSRGHAPEVVVHTWRPACCRNVEPHGFGDTVGMSKRTRPSIPGFVDSVEAERDAVGKQGIATVRIEGGERVPEVSRLARQLLRPLPMPIVDSLGDPG